MDAQFGQIRRAVPVQRLHRLCHLDGVAGGAAQRLVHVGDERRRPFARAGADVDHRLRQGQRVLLGLHKGAGAGLNVQQNRIRTGGNLLAHDAGVSATASSPLWPISEMPTSLTMSKNSSSGRAVR